MGKMVADTRSAVAALSALEEVDASRIQLMGYALGAKVGLLTAAFDDRVKAVAAVAASILCVWTGPGMPRKASATTPIFTV